MTTPPQRSARRAVVPLLRIVVAAQALRIVVAVIGGLVANREHLPGPDFGVHPAENGAEQLLQFASAGDGEGAILMVLGAVLLWLVAMLPRSERTWHGDFIATSVLLGLTSVSCVLTAVAYIWFASEPVGFPTSQEVQLVGFSIVYAALTAAMLYVVRGIHATVTSTAVDSGDEENDDEEGAAVFAVDRKTGAVLVWSSQAEARAKAPLFGIEDDEYEWFLDDGVMLVAAANGQDVSFTPTGEERPEDLLRHLKDYVERRGLRIDEEEADEPLAYVDPIARDHYLEMWPGWLRWLGRLTR
jgi:hypothetical protein